LNCLALMRIRGQTAIGLMQPPGCTEKVWVVSCQLIQFFPGLSESAWKGGWRLKGNYMEARQNPDREGCILVYSSARGSYRWQ